MNKSNRHIPGSMLTTRFILPSVLILIAFSYAYAQSIDTSNIISSPMPDSGNPLIAEQISCDPSTCIEIEVLNEEQNNIAEDKVIQLIRNNASKILVNFQEERFGIGHDRNKVWKEYIREIAKRDGMVVFEPFYLRSRGFQLTDIPVFGDYFRVGWSIYSRIRSVILYSAMKNYNAKILYHPETQEIMMMYFVHRNFGSICETVFSQCNVIEYLDDEIFDMQLKQALEKYPVDEILIRFNQTEAMLPLSSIQMEALLSMNRSSRLYKWLIAAKTVEKKPEVRDRYMSAQTVLMIIDYSLAAYDLVQAIRMYAIAREWKATAYYTTEEFGDKFRSVQFSKIHKKL